MKCVVVKSFFYNGKVLLPGTVVDLNRDEYYELKENKAVKDFENEIKKELKFPFQTKELKNNKSTK
jgi:hypothetical protein